MNAKFLAAAALLVAATSAFAADDAPTGASATTAASSAAAVSASAQALNLPTVTVPASHSRAEVHAEAVDFVAHYKTMLEVQLELAKN